MPDPVVSHPFADYVLKYRGVVTKQRWHEYRAGLLDSNQIAVLYQDMIEAECLPAARVDHATHMCEMGLCRVPDMMVYQ